MADAKEIINQALALFRAGNLPAAERALREGRRAWPRDADLVRLQAWIKGQVGERDTALALFDETLRLDPQLAMAWFNRGCLLFEMERFEEAAASFQETLQRRTDHVDAWLNRGRAFLKLGRLEEASADFSEGLRLRPDDADALHQHALTLHGLGALQEALAQFDRALSLRRADAELASDRAAVLFALGRRDEAMAIFDAVVSRAPHLQSAALHRARAIYNTATEKLTEGSFEEGFRLYESRHAAGAIETPSYADGQPQWRGESLIGVLRVWPEQGVGEALAFSRLLRLALKRTPRVALQCDARLVPLMRRSFPELETVVGTSQPISDAETQCPVASLPFAMQLRREDLNARTAYLRSNVDLTKALRSKYEALAAGRPIVGISWTSANRAIGDYKSSRLADWGALLRDGCFFVNVQYGDTRAEVEEAVRAFGCEILSDADVDQWRDLDAFAAQVAALDAVVSVSNSTVHMAGALGKRCLVLTPEPRGLLWFWGYEGETTWYESVRAVRHRPEEGWSGQVARAAQMLRTQLPGAGA